MTLKFKHTNLKSEQFHMFWQWNVAVAVIVSGSFPFF